MHGKRDNKLIMMVLSPREERDRMREGAHIREGVQLHKCITNYFFNLKITEIGYNIKN